jgi:hypothetical protein
VRGGNGVNGHEADIVAVEGVVRPGIAEADKELHRVVPIEGAGRSAAKTEG